MFWEYKTAKNDRYVNSEILYFWWVCAQCTDMSGRRSFALELATGSLKRQPAAFGGAGRPSVWANKRSHKIMPQNNTPTLLESPRTHESYHSQSSVVFWRILIQRRWVETPSDVANPLHIIMKHNYILKWHFRRLPFNTDHCKVRTGSNISVLLLLRLINHEWTERCLRMEV